AALERRLDVQAVAPAITDDGRDRCLDVRREPHRAADAIAARVAVAEEPFASYDPRRDSAPPQLHDPLLTRVACGVKIQVNDVAQHARVAVYAWRRACGRGGAPRLRAKGGRSN